MNFKAGWPIGQQIKKRISISLVFSMIEDKSLKLQYSQFVFVCKMQTSMLPSGIVTCSKSKPFVSKGLLKRTGKITFESIPSFSRIVFTFKLNNYRQSYTSQVLYTFEESCSAQLFGPIRNGKEAD